MSSELLDAVQGDPIEVSAAARTFASIAAEVASIAASLRALNSGDANWRGAAAGSAYARTATLPPKLDKATASYAAAGAALSSYARALADVQQQSGMAVATARRAADDLRVAQAAQAAAVETDAAALAATAAANLPSPMPIAPRHQGSIDDASTRLNRATASNELAHEQLRTAARLAAAALRNAAHEGIHNDSWMHHFTHAVGHWASTQWAGALRELSMAANVVSALAGMAALAMSVAGIFFPPLEAAAAVLESISLASTILATGADAILAATGHGSWADVGVDALTLLPAGLGKVVTKAGPAIREGRFLRPTTVAHAHTGIPSPCIVGRGVRTRMINYRPTEAEPKWGITQRHLAKHFFGPGPKSLSTIDPAGNAEVWVAHLQELASRSPTAILNEGIQDIVGTFQKVDGTGTFKMGIRISPATDGTFNLVTLLTRQ